MAGAGAYALASGVNGDNYDQKDTYYLNLVNGLSGAAGAVGGAFVSALADYAVRAYCCVRDRGVAESPAPSTSLGRPVVKGDVDEPENDPESQQRVNADGLKESKTSAVELEPKPEPEQQVTEGDFETVNSAAAPTTAPKPTKKILAGAVPALGAADVDHWIDLSRQFNKGRAGNQPS